MAIQTELRNSRNEIEKLDHHDPRYWEGPYRYVAYPKALFRQTQPGEKAECRVVQNETERDRLGSDWHESPADAAEAFTRLEADIAKAAAERNAADRRLSAKAIGEALRADRATDELLPEIPEKPRRGRPRKQPETT